MARLLLILAVGATLVVGIGCGGDDSSDSGSSSPEPCEADPPAPTGTTAEAARQAVVAYFLSCDAASCTEDVTENHIRMDYSGKLARCEEVRRNNRLARDDFRVAGEAEVSGKVAKVRGQVLVTGEIFDVTLKNVDGSWKIDRIRGSQ